MIEQNNTIRFDGMKAMREAREVTTEQDMQLEYFVFDSPLQSFSKVFEDVVIGGDIKKYTEMILNEKKGEAIGIEFGGIAVNLFEGFDDGFFKQTIGVSLADYRTKSGQLKEGGAKKIYPDGRQHNIIIGNLFDREIYQKINKITRGKKVDFIIERMLGGFENVPNNSPLVLMVVLQKWYEMLNEGGLLLIQIPWPMEDIAKEWVKLLQNGKYKQGVDVGFSESRWVSLRIHKLKKAPDRLPVLKIDEIKKILKKES